MNQSDGVLKPSLHPLLRLCWMWLGAPQLLPLNCNSTTGIIQPAEQLGLWRFCVDLKLRTALQDSSVLSATSV